MMGGFMDLYLFPHIESDPMVQWLFALREKREPGTGLFPHWIDFAMNRAYTRNTAAEYVLRLLLKNPPDCRNEALIRPYLERDAAWLYRNVFAVDWDKVCRETGLLPLPSGPGGPSLGEVSFRETVKRLTACKSPMELCEGLLAFFRSYRDEDEAMYRAFRWDGTLNGILCPDPVTFQELDGLAPQKRALTANTRAFLAGLPANDVLLVGSGGTGKSSCVKATLNRFADEGLRLVEVLCRDLSSLPALMEALASRKKRYIVFIDDLSFVSADPGYLELKVILDGQISKRPDNVLIYATSNRRHLIRESWRDREEEDIHQNDAVHEKISLSARFGIRLTFQVLSQAEYFRIVELLLQRQGVSFTDEIGRQAAAWATDNGRSGRTAKQFAAHYFASLEPKRWQRWE